MNSYYQQSGNRTKRNCIRKLRKQFEILKSISSERKSKQRKRIRQLLEFNKELKKNRKGCTRRIG